MPRTAICAAGGNPAVRAVLVCTVWCVWIPGAIGTAGEIAPAMHASQTADNTLPADADPTIQLVEGRSPAEADLDDRVLVLREGTSSVAARRAAAARLPLNRMTAANRQRAETILKDLSLFRELPVLSFEVNPAVHRFFTTHPDVAVSIWRVLRISQFQMWQTGPETYEADAGDGTVGVVDALYRSADEQVIVCEGLLASPILPKKIKASALMHLTSSFAPDAAGRQHVTSRLSLFVSFPSQTIETAAKLISPLANTIVDRNFSEVCLFVHMMSLAMERQPGWVEQLAGRLEGVLEPHKAQLVQVTAQVYVTERRRQSGTEAPRGYYSTEDVPRPSTPATTAERSPGVTTLR